MRRARHVGHYWRNKGELISDVLLWNPSHGRTREGKPGRTYLQQLCTDTECSLEDLLRARNEWRKRVKEIWACSTPLWYIYIYIYIYIHDDIYIYIYIYTWWYIYIYIYICVYINRATIGCSIHESIFFKWTGKWAEDIRFSTIFCGGKVFVRKGQLMHL